jgi:glycosyltransferase involved in cell wall biosynthesis
MQSDDMDRARTHLVLMPSYNTGAKIFDVVAEACSYWRDVWVVIDGSTDGSGEALATRAGQQIGLRIIRRLQNGGKGAAVLDGLRPAAADGFTHVLIMDADGQHPAAAIREFISLSRENPHAMILGQPVFDRNAPRARVFGRRLANIVTRLETGRNIGDSLFGFRVYPLRALLELMESSRRMRRFDFDTEALVRLSWAGVRAIRRPVPVRYFRSDEGGVSHFRYSRDNILLAAMHVRLMVECWQKKRLGRKQFFFEKKNQKTFALLVDSIRTNEP